jgi:hypothetical protein
MLGVGFLGGFVLKEDDDSFLVSAIGCNLFDARRCGPHL